MGIMFFMLFFSLCHPNVNIQQKKEHPYFRVKYLEDKSLVLFLLIK